MRLQTLFKHSEGSGGGMIPGMAFQEKGAPREKGKQASAGEDNAKANKDRQGGVKEQGDFQSKGLNLTAKTERVKAE